MAKGRYVSLAEAKQMLEKESELRDLTPDQRSAMEHAAKTAKIDTADAQKVAEEVLALGFASEMVATKIADIMPQHPEDVRAIFAKERMVLEKSHIDQIIDIVVKYL